MINRRNFTKSLAGTCLAFTLPISKNLNQYCPYKIGQRVKHKLLNEDSVFTIISIGTPEEDKGFLYFKEIDRHILVNHNIWKDIENCRNKDIYIIESDKPCYVISEKIFNENKILCKHIKNYKDLPKHLMFTSAHDHIIPI